MKAKKIPVKFTPEMHEQIARLVGKIGNDGHTLWAASVLSEFPAELQAKHVRRYDSNGTPKGTISKNGVILPGLIAVYGLYLLGAICSDLDLESESKNGRGSQARAYTAAILGWLLRNLTQRQLPDPAERLAIDKSRGAKFEEASK